MVPVKISVHGTKLELLVGGLPLAESCLSFSLEKHGGYYAVLKLELLCSKVELDADKSELRAILNHETAF